MYVDSDGSPCSPDIDTRKVLTVEQLRAALAELPPDATVEVNALRNLWVEKNGAEIGWIDFGLDEGLHLSENPPA